MQSVRPSLPSLVVAATAAGMIVQLFSPDSVLRGDTTYYVDHATNMLDARIPYVDFDFEHLPLAAVPMLLAGLLARMVPGLDYNGAFVVLTTLAMIAIALTIRAIGHSQSDEAAANRWLLITAPMFPFLLYRVDPWSVLFAALALLGVARNQRSLYLSSAVLGVAIKGWPALFAIRDFLAGRKQRALALLGATGALAVVLMSLPSFRSGRSFEGVHLETFSGSLTLAWRLATELPHGIATHAGALYIGVGSWAIMLNIIVGGAVSVLTLVLYRRSPLTDTLLMALAVLGLLLASPLLSAQFLMWSTPFVALVRDRSATVLTAATGAVSTVLLTWWDPTNFSWAMLLVARNLLLVSLAVALLRLARDRTVRSPSTAAL